MSYYVNSFSLFHSFFVIIFAAATKEFCGGSFSILGD